jgi:hypothetical protein
VGVLALAALGAWLALFRDTAEPVTVGEAVTSFRTDTEAPSGASPIPVGVYVYATDGYEKTDALTGVTHRYPRRSTITVAASDCGASLTWRVLEGRSTEWVLCVADDGWELRSQDERHTFFGRTERTTYVCEDTLVRPKRGTPAQWPVTCATGSVGERGRTTLLGRGVELVGGKPVEVERVRKTTSFTGSTRGTSRYEFAFDVRTGVPVRVALLSRTTNDSPVGDVHYEEDVTLRLLSLEPRR